MFALHRHETGINYGREGRGERSLGRANMGLGLVCTCNFPSRVFLSSSCLGSDTGAGCGRKPIDYSIHVCWNVKS
jgi:hypothetical protein